MPRNTRWSINNTESYILLPYPKSGPRYILKTVHVHILFPTFSRPPAFVTHRGDPPRLDSQIVRSRILLLIETARTPYTHRSPEKKTNADCPIRIGSLYRPINQGYKGSLWKVLAAPALPRSVNLFFQERVCDASLPVSRRCARAHATGPLNAVFGKCVTWRSSFFSLSRSRASERRPSVQLLCIDDAAPIACGFFLGNPVCDARKTELRIDWLFIL